MICYDKLWKTLIDHHMNKTELRDRIGISNATLAKFGKNEPVNLKIIESICQELHCGIEDVVEIKLWDYREIYNYMEYMESVDI